MSDLASIVNFCDDFLKIQATEDYPAAYNGLQVENSRKIKKIAAAVDANLLTVEQAVEHNIDCLFVHHGLFWGKSLPITGTNYQKYKLLIDNNIALYSAHLPIDMHDKIGNNISIINALALNCSCKIAGEHNFSLPIANCNYNRNILREKILNIFLLSKCVEFGTDDPKKIAICSGGGGEIIMDVFDGSFDTIIVGEVQRHFFDFVYENKLNAYVCGHYNTEVFGIKNLSELVAKKFELECLWFSENCPF